MSESRSPDPLEQWKEAYNRSGTASLQALAQLAHMSRWIAGYRERSADAHLVLFALTRENAYLFQALQLLDALPKPQTAPDGTTTLSLLEPGIALFKAALERAEPQTRWHTALLRGQATLLFSRAQQTARPDHLAEAVQALGELLAALPPDSADRPSIAATLAHARRQLVRSTGDADGLVATLNEFEQAVAGYPPTLQGYWELLLDTARTAAEVAMRVEKPDSFGRAVALFEQAAAGDAQTRSTAADDVVTLTLSALRRWQEEGRVEDFEHALDGWRAAVRLSEDQPDRLTQNLNNLVATLQMGREQLGRDTDLDEQLAAQQRLVTQLRQDDPRQLEHLVNLALLHRERFKLRHERADIDGTIEAFGRAVDAAEGAEVGSSGPSRRSLVIDLGTVLRERYQWSGELPDVDASLAFWRGLLEAAPPAQPEHAEWLGGVVGTLVDRYQRSRHAQDLDAAVDAVDAALGATAQQDLSAAHRHRLGQVAVAAVQERYRALRRVEDLDRLVLLSRQALDEAEPGSPEHTPLAVDYALFLLQRFDRESDQGDLNDAIAVLEASVPDPSAAATTENGAGARSLTLLGEALLKRYDLWGMPQLDELARARGYLERAVELTPRGAPGRVAALRGLAAATERLFRTMPVIAGDRDLPLRVLEQALAEAADDPVTAATVGRSLAQELLQLAASGRRRRGDLNRAVDLLERAAAAGAGFEASGGQVELADALRLRYQRRRRPSDRARAIAAYRAGLPVELETTVHQAMVDAARWGAWAAQRRSWAEAAEAFGIAVRAGEEIYLANVGVGASVWLGRAAGLAAEAAYAFARAGRPADGALALEAARFRAGSESLALVHADLGELARDHPELAERLRRAAARWRQTSRLADTPPPGPRTISLSLSLEPLRAAAGLPVEQPPDGATGSAPAAPANDERHGEPSARVDRSGWESAGRAGRQARGDLEEAMQAVREIAGFERFLDPPTQSDIHAVCDRVPLVYLASASRGGLAVAFRPGRPARAAFLPSLGRSALDAEVSEFREAYQARAADPQRWRDQLAATTRWLWDAAMARALALLGRSGRVVLVPTGPLGLLPLHAAWRPASRSPTGRRYACDRVVISYAPNARAVAATAGEGADSLLAVEDPAPLPASLPALAFSGPEVAAATAWYPHATVLPHEQATVERVLEGLTAASVYHLACHGRVDLAAPRRSALVLAGGRRLTVQQLLDLRLDVRAGSRLAVLTACETALAGTKLPDEVISLPAAMLQAGLSGVVATQWAVVGLPTAFLVARFYQHWKHDHLDWADSLVAAQRWLRDSTDGEKAAFVHPRHGTALLPVSARRALWRAVAGRDAAGRSFADIADWGAYTYVGDMRALVGAGARPGRSRAGRSKADG